MKKNEIEEVVNIPYWEHITIEKSHNDKRIKFMSFHVKAAEKSNLTQLVMDLLITITQKQGYKSYFDSKAIDPFALEETQSLLSEKDARIKILEQENERLRGRHL